MLDLKTARLPSALYVDGNFYAIHTDFRFWLRFFDKFKNNAKPLLSDFDYIYQSAMPLNRQAGFDEMLKFATPKSPLPRDIGGKNKKLIDFDLDGDYIFAAFYERYHIDLFDDKIRLHWHKFKALLNGLHDTKLNEIMSARGYDEHNKDDYQKSMIKNRQQWELTEEIEMTDAEKELQAKFESQFE